MSGRFLRGAAWCGKLLFVVGDEFVGGAFRWLFNTKAHPSVKKLKWSLMGAGALWFGLSGDPAVEQQHEANAAPQRDLQEQVQEEVSRRLAAPAARGEGFFDRLVRGLKLPSLQDSFSRSGGNFALPARAPDHMRLAHSFLEKGEHNDKETVNRFIRQMGKTGDIDITETLWCAGFLNAVECAAGRKGTNSLMAKSFENYGTATDTPQYGDIVVLRRENNKGKLLGHHVTYYMGPKDGSSFYTLGGNQMGEAVTVGTHQYSKVIAFRRPPYDEQYSVNPCLSAPGMGR